MTLLRFVYQILNSLWLSHFLEM